MLCSSKKPTAGRPPPDEALRGSSTEGVAAGHRKTPVAVHVGTLPVDGGDTVDRHRLAAPAAAQVLRRYRRTLQSDRRHLLEQFELKGVARKVAGVGSVGTRAWALLPEAGEGIEPLFLQGKEAQASVLADFCGRSTYANQGQRVVAGQHLMQAASDIFLGWDRITGFDGVERDFLRLRDWKFSLPIEKMIPNGMAR